MSRLHARTDGLVALVSQAALQAWRKLMGVVGADWRPRPDRGSTPELCYLQAIARLRTDSLEASERRFAKFLEAHPTAFYAIEEHAAILDRLGRREQALAGYERARTGRQLLKRGMPDRPFFMRHRTTSVAEINGYTNVLRAGPSKRGAFVYVARGHAYLATRRPRLALLDYDMALKLRPDQTHLLVAKGEALLALGPSCRGLAGPRPGRCRDARRMPTRSAAAPSCSWRSVASPRPMPTGCGNSSCCRGSAMTREPVCGCNSPTTKWPWTNWSRRSRGAAGDPYLQPLLSDGGPAASRPRPTRVFCDGCLARSPDRPSRGASSAQRRRCSVPTRRSVAPKPCSSLAYVPLAATATRPADRGGKSSRAPVRTRSNMQPRDTKSRSLAWSRGPSASRLRHSEE